MDEPQVDRAKHPRPDEPHPIQGVDNDDATSPLGRGANPGDKPSTYPLSDTRGSNAGQRGPNIPGARGGPSGMVDRENEDVKPSARRDASDGGVQSSANDQGMDRE